MAYNNIPKTIIWHIKCNRGVIICHQKEVQLILIAFIESRQKSAVPGKFNKAKKV